MIELFHEGTSDVVNGITCKRITVNEYGFEHYLDEGWVFDPKELLKPSKKVEKDNKDDNKS